MRIRLEFSKSEATKLNSMINSIYKEINTIMEIPTTEKPNLLTDEHMLTKSNNKICRYRGIKTQDNRYIVEFALKTAFVNSCITLFHMFYKNLATFCISMKKHIMNFAEFF